ncbi:hypothetical protein E3A20_12540 [Planctomyces bekefii]|uniref:Uncharacterized protein n=1 Tax=Planctomyces bekefii TaxID=1653850 RepID=A0A5C6M630_9PLAN|nr:hypothetical protein E3A20_12540 [Planctomyces bekefii]
MDITVKITKENKDGSADAIVRFDKLGLEVLVQWGLIAMLKEGLNEYATSDQVKERASLAPIKTAKGRKPATKKKPLAKKAK